ncbi:MAG: VOC family protein [Sphingobium sp.]
MFSHMTIGSNDLERSRIFYDALFGAVGGRPGRRMPDREAILYAHNGGMLMVVTPIDGKPATYANGGTIGFAMDGPEQATAWHDAGVAAGGVSIENPPGIRMMAGAGPLYLAYLRDPDGNKLCAMHRPEQ